MTTPTPPSADAKILMNAISMEDQLIVKDKRIKELESENLALAAHQCSSSYSDDFGNTRCKYQDDISALTNMVSRCFTCGKEAVVIINLPNGCAAFPGTRGVVGLCPQHEISIQPNEPYTVIADCRSVEKVL